MKRKVVVEEGTHQEKKKFVGKVWFEQWMWYS